MSKKLLVAAVAAVGGLVAWKKVAADRGAEARPVGRGDRQGRLTHPSRRRRRAPGDVAQLAEHRLCKAGVRGSSPLVSTHRATDCDARTDAPPAWCAGGPLSGADGSRRLRRSRLALAGALLLPFAAASETFFARAVETGSVVVRSTLGPPRRRRRAPRPGWRRPGRRWSGRRRLLTAVTLPTGAAAGAAGVGGVVQASTGSLLRATQAFQPAYAAPSTVASRNSLRSRCFFALGGSTSPLRAARAALPRVAASPRAGSVAASARGDGAGDRRAARRS